MSIPTVYIKGSKKQANEKLAAGQEVSCQSFSMFGDNYSRLSACPDGTVIKFYDKLVGGSPYAKSYGNWRPAKRKIV